MAKLLKPRLTTKKNQEIKEHCVVMILGIAKDLRIENWMIVSQSDHNCCQRGSKGSVRKMFDFESL